MEHTREAITKEQMRKFLKFVHDDNVYCKTRNENWLCDSTESIGKGAIWTEENQNSKNGFGAVVDRTDQ